jgi:cytochrome oxidase Cu insertion factor (SCO1/SenC/PrrC family)
MRSAGMRGFAAITLAVALVAVAIASGEATAHQGRGLMVQEGVITARPDPTYQPPPPETLGGPFELTDHTGRKVTHETWRGKWMVMFFGFAGCREACPVALDRMTQALEDLGPAAANIQPLFVDLDFAGPDLPALAQFVSHFHPRLVGLTGNRRQMYSMLRLYQVRREIKHRAQGKKETGPRIDHSTYFFLVDPDGKTRTYFHHSKTPAEMVAHMKRYL